MTKRAGNYLIQSNYFTKSVLRDASEMQKEILYYLQSEIDFHDPNATGSVVFNFEKFLKYKNIKGVGRRKVKKTGLRIKSIKI